MPLYIQCADTIKLSIHGDGDGDGGGGGSGGVVGGEWVVNNNRISSRVKDRLGVELRSILVLYNQ